MAVKQQKKVIISCAVTGAIHTPSLSPYFPATPDQIVQQAVDAYHAGAAILHIHARNQSQSEILKLLDIFFPQ